MPISIAGASITLANSSYTYDGTAHEPAVTSVSVNDRKVDASNYDLTYSSNKNAGTAKVTLTGKNCYKGTAGATFTIAKADPEYAAPSAVEANCCDLLKNVALPQGFAWENSSDTVGSVGTEEHMAIFVPEDAKNYNTIRDISVSVNVSHSFSKTAFDTKGHWTVCACGEKTASEAHSYVHKKTAAKIGVAGKEWDRCSVCGREANVRKIAALKPATTKITKLTAAKKAFSAWSVKKSVKVK